ncbi:hypothetical protein MSG28_011494 [Choristoneura fumiferana]|uniref:Uncharacterized protein n=1 Tax=Choristoneura fumiferana TaxID=7141 RepID=A0ACC0JNS2_CHOFU|nr:hypothetical protein MSG28_011494 [Choristoneura fumiferana]
MKTLLTILIVSAVGTLGVRHADIDINRVKLLPNLVPDHSSYKQIRRPSLEKNERLIIRSNDYDDHSSWYQHPRAPIPVVHDTPTAAGSEAPLQVYQPREDPRLFYQSDAYLKENGAKNVKNEVSYIYPGRDVIRAGEDKAEQYSRLRSKEIDSQNSSAGDSGICIKCPHDRTLVAKASFGRVVLQKPTLLACSGRRAPRSTKFVQMYGPKFGALLEQGSHMVIGQIMDRNKKLQLCKMQVHVIVQGCATPKYLVAHCWEHNTQCNFTCRNSQLELSGPPTQTCGDDLKWKGDLPVCKGRNSWRRHRARRRFPLPCPVRTWLPKPPCHTSMPPRCVDAAPSMPAETKFTKKLARY